MKRGIARLLGCTWLGLSLGAGLVAGCGKVAEPDQLGGETHWLRTCSEPGDCGSELECWCGVCTAVCDDDATCGAIVDDARCVPRARAPFAASCGPATPARLCAEEPAQGSGGTSDPGSNAPLACQGPQVVVLGECLDCDPARVRIAEQMDTLIETSGWNTCERDADCVTHEWSTPCDGQCPVSISSTAVATFEAAIDGFATLVCDPNLWQLSCGNPRAVDCDVAPLCVDGLCRIGALPCAERSQDSCAGDGECVLYEGYLLSSSRSCYESGRIVVACVDADLGDPEQGCPTEFRRFTSASGCLGVTSCAPPGYREIEAGDVCDVERCPE
jgi:hypothetical protein